MTQTRSKTRKPATKPSNGVVKVADPGDVLSLAEAAAYLRWPEADVLRCVREQGLGGREVGGEWRFLRTAIQDWLSGKPNDDIEKNGIWESLGVFKDDPHLDEIVREAYRRRGRPIAEDE